MSQTVSQALRVMSIGLPIMFAVIITFIFVAKILVALFPYQKNEEE